MKIYQLLKKNRAKCLVTSFSVVYGIFQFINISKEGYGYPLYSAIIFEHLHNFTGLLRDSLDPYNLFAVGKPPLPMILDWLSVKIFGFNSLGLLFTPILANLLTLILLLKIFRNYLSRDKFAYLAPLGAFLTPSFFAIGRVNIPDSVFILMLLLSIYFILEYNHKNKKIYFYLALITICSADLSKLYMTVLVMPALIAALLLKNNRKIVKIKDITIFTLVALATPIIWATLYIKLPGKVPFLGGTGDGNPYNLIFISQGIGRAVSSLSGNLFKLAVMPSDMAYPLYQKAGILRLFKEPYITQYGFFLPILLYSVLTLPRSIKNKEILNTLFTIWFLSVFLGITLSQGPVCCTHPYYTSLFAPAIGILVTSFILKPISNGKLSLLGFNIILSTFLIYHQQFHNYKNLAVVEIAIVLPIFIDISLKFLGKISIQDKTRHQEHQRIKVATILLLAPLLMVSSNYLGMSFSHRHGDPLVGGFAYENSKNALVTAYLDKKTALKGVGQSMAEVKLLQPGLINYVKNDNHYWSAATLRAYIAAPLEIATGKAVLPIGRETGSESILNFNDFKNLIRERKLCTFIVDSRDISMLNPQNTLSKYSYMNYQEVKYVLEYGIREPLSGINPPAIFNLCQKPWSYK